ncbi:hypothetical protein BDP27DRAFT_1339969, partial [Rhodocollybia butyracea]
MIFLSRPVSSYFHHKRMLPHLRILLLYSPFLIRLSPPYPCPKLYKSEDMYYLPILMMLTLCHFVVASVGKNLWAECSFR